MSGFYTVQKELRSTVVVLMHRNSEKTERRGYELLQDLVYEKKLKDTTVYCDWRLSEEECRLE